MTRLLSSPMIRADLADNVRWIATTPTASDPDLVLSGPNGITGFRFVQDSQVKTPAYACNLLWVLVNYWNMYRVTMDAALLPDLYAILRGSVNHQAHLATKGSDGVYHLPPMDSPEYPLGAEGGDTNYQLGTRARICGVYVCVCVRARVCLCVIVCVCECECDIDDSPISALVTRQF